MFEYNTLSMILAAAFIVSGWLIWKRGKTDLIHKYNIQGVKDLKGYGIEMGKTIFALGVIILSSSIMSFIPQIHRSFRIGISIVGLIIVTIFVFRIQKKYSGRYI